MIISVYLLAIAAIACLVGTSSPRTKNARDNPVQYDRYHFAVDNVNRVQLLRRANKRLLKRTAKKRGIEKRVAKDPEGSAGSKKGGKKKQKRKKKEKKQKNRTEEGSSSKTPMTTTIMPPTEITSLTPPEDGNTGGIEEIGAGKLDSVHYYKSSEKLSGSENGEGEVVNEFVNENLPWIIRSINANDIGGYFKCSDMEDDLISATNFFVGRRISYYAEQEFMYGRPETPRPNDATKNQQDPGNGDSSNKDKDESSYATNVQVEGVDEADFVKSDGAVVYAAYGDAVIVFDAETGLLLSETIVSVSDFEPNGCNPTVKDDFEHVDKEDNGGIKGGEEIGEKKGIGTDQTNNATIENVSPESSRAPEREESLSMPPNTCYCRPETRIRGLLLYEERLVVFVSSSNTYCIRQATPIQNRPILSDSGSSKAIVYDTKSLITTTLKNGSRLRQMKEMSAVDLPGSYVDGRMIGSAIYAITRSTVNLWDNIESHITRWNERYRGMNKEQYMFAAVQLAKDKVVPSFVTRLRKELQDQHGGTCSNIVKLSAFHTGDVDLYENSWLEHRGIFGGIVSISSFNVRRDLTAPLIRESKPVAPLWLKSSTVFFPDQWQLTLYATKNYLFLATNGCDQHVDFSGCLESTFLYGFVLSEEEGGSGENLPLAEVAGIGKVAGGMLNQYSMSYHRDHLYVATTTPAQFGCINKVKQETESEAEERGDKIVERISCKRGMIRGPRNHVTVLEVPQGQSNGKNTLMRPVGQTDHLGELDETITAAKFMGDLGFVVTFRRIDPLILLDLKNPSEPAIIGELKVTGSSNFLYPTNDNTETILALGIEVNATTEQQIGLHLSIFGFEEKSSPKLLARFMFEERLNQWSSSLAQVDAKAWRYLPQSGVALLPVNIHGGCLLDKETGKRRNDIFDGFFVLDINTNPQSASIKKRFQANLVDPEGWCVGTRRCYYNGYLPARSAVIGNNIILMVGHGAHGYNVASAGGKNPKPLWTLDFDINLPRKQCRSYWLSG